MAGSKIVYISERVHKKLKIISAQRGRPMGKLIEEMVDAEMDDQTNPWLGPAGLNLQQTAAIDAWDDPDLDVYNDE